MSRAHRPLTARVTPPPGRVTVVRPGINILDERVREVALELADGDARRIEVISHVEAIVHSSPRLRDGAAERRAQILQAGKRRQKVTARV